MDQIKEGDGTLLDHTTIVMGSNFEMLPGTPVTIYKIVLFVIGGLFRHQVYRDRY